MPRFVYRLIPGLLVSAISCTPADPGATGRAGVSEEADAKPDLLDELERRVAEVSARARESAVALEYSAADAPSGARRVATGVVVDAQGDVLSIRIDRPPAAAPIVARDASGRRLPVQWVAEDPETGLTLLRIEARHARPTRATRRPRAWGARCSSSATRSAWDTRSSGAWFRASTAGWSWGRGSSAV